MTTVEILQERDGGNQLRYRAISGELQANGETPGQALDNLERVLASSPGEAEPDLLVIIQRFRPDVFFTQAQQERLRALMDRFHQIQAQGGALPPEDQAELEQLVDAEWDAAIARGQAIIDQSTTPGSSN
jgi:hypothetical protein